MYTAEELKVMNMEALRSAAYEVGMTEEVVMGINNVMKLAKAIREAQDALVEEQARPQLVDPPNPTEADVLATHDEFKLQAQRPDENDPRSWVTVHESAVESDSRIVQIYSNGKPYLLERGKKVPLPASAIDVLEHAVQFKTRQDEHGNIIATPSPRYPYAVHGPVV